MIQDALLVLITDHLHATFEVLTAIVPDPPDLVKLLLVGEIVKVHAKGANDAVTLLSAVMDLISH